MAVPMRVMAEAGIQPLSTFGRYQLLLEMARGGMATLYLARLRGPRSFEKLIVVKRIHDHYSTEESFTQMFLDEARIAAQDESGEVRLASSAAVPTKPVGPRKKQNTIMAGALGLLTSVFGVFAVEYWRGTTAAPPSEA